MNDIEQQQRFVSFRAEGRSFARIADELQLSKPTLINWSRKFQFEIQNQRVLLREHLQEKWLSSVDLRVNSLGEHLRKIEAELAKRDIATLTTGQLSSVADSLRRQIKRELGPMAFTTPVSQIPNDELLETMTPVRSLRPWQRRSCRIPEAHLTHLCQPGSEGFVAEKLKCAVI